MRYLLLILALILFTSCGSRKVETAKAESKSDVKQVEKAESETKQETQIVTTKEDVKLIVADTTKPVTRVKDGNKTIWTNVKVIEERSDNSTQNALKEVKEQRETKTDAVVKTQTKDRKSDKKESYSYIFWILLVLFIIWLYFRYRIKR